MMMMITDHCVFLNILMVHLASAVVDNENTAPVFPFDLPTALSAVSHLRENFTSVLPRWYSYKFDGGTTGTYIRNGGRNMYDKGNYISVTENGNVVYSVNYGATHNFGRSQFSSRASLPFTALLKIDNPAKDHLIYTIQVRGTAGKGNKRQVDSFNITLGNFAMNIFVFQAFGSAEASVCEIYFVLHSEKAWKSGLPTTLEKKFGTSGHNLDNSFTISGKPSHVVMGYTLLSSFGWSSGPRFEISDIREAMDIMIYALGDGNNECVFGTHSCHEDAVCVDTETSFTCKCKLGLNGDGIICEDVNECSAGTHNCHVNATCTNTIGSFKCTCSSNMIGDGVTCQDFLTVCSSSSMSFRIGSDYFLRKGVGLKDLYLQDFSCQGKQDPSTANAWLFNISSFSSCGTILAENSSHLTYSNTLINWIYTGTAHLISFSCTYEKDLNNVTLLSTRYNVIKNIANLTAPSGKGEFIATLNRYNDKNYSRSDIRSEYETTDTLFIKAEVLTKNPTLNLVFDQCWVTPTSNLADSMRYVFINHSCPIKKRVGNVQITRSGRGRIAHFQSQVFAFVNYDTMYLHCTLKICSSSERENCVPTCLSHTKSTVPPENLYLVRKKRSLYNDISEKETLSIGPLNLRKDTSGSSVDSLVLFSRTSILVIIVGFVAFSCCIAIIAFCWFHGCRN